MDSSNSLLQRFLAVVASEKDVYSYINNQPFIEEYVVSKFPRTLPLLIIGSLVLLSFPIFVCSRCCCAKRCCAARFAPKEYSKFQKGIPLALYYIGLVASVACAVTGGFIGKFVYLWRNSFSNEDY